MHNRTQNETGIPNSSGSIPSISDMPSDTSEPPPVIDNPFDRIEINAETAFVYDCFSKSILYNNNDMDKRLYPASITKLFTAYTVLQYMNPAEVITAGEELQLMQPGSFIAYILKGHRLTVEMLIEAMLLPSGNDAAYVIAAATGRIIRPDSYLSAEDAVAVFVGEMNHQAQIVGLQNTNFTNPDGYHDESHYTCTNDIIRIAEIVLDIDIIVKYTSMEDDKVVYESGQINTWRNTNQLLNRESPYYCANAIGLKTGRTEEAGYCLLSAVSGDSIRAIIGVFGCTSSHDRFTDTIQLIGAL